MMLTRSISVRQRSVLEAMLTGSVQQAQQSGTASTVLQRSVTRLYLFSALLSAIQDIADDLAHHLVEAGDDPDRVRTAIDYTARLIGATTLANCAGIPSMQRYFDPDPPPDDTEANSTESGTFDPFDVNQLATSCLALGIERDSVRLLFVLASNLVLAASMVDSDLDEHILLFWREQDAALESLYQRMAVFLPDLAHQTSEVARLLLESFER